MRQTSERRLTSQTVPCSVDSKSATCCEPGPPAATPVAATDTIERAGAADPAEAATPKAARKRPSVADARTTDANTLRYVNAPHDRLQAPATRQEVAGRLGGLEGIRGRRRSVADEVLLARDVRVSVRPRACGPPPELHHRRPDGAHEPDARPQRAASVRLGRVRAARRERRHPDRHAPRDLHAEQHRPY